MLFWMLASSRTPLRRCGCPFPSLEICKLEAFSIGLSGSIDLWYTRSVVDIKGSKQLRLALSPALSPHVGAISDLTVQVDVAHRLCVPGGL